MPFQLKLKLPILALSLHPAYLIEEQTETILGTADYGQEDNNSDQKKLR